MKIIVITAGILLGAFFPSIIQASDPQKNKEQQRIITLTDFNFEQQIKNRVVLVDFWASWCGPCRMMSPVLQDVSGDLSGNKYVGKVDVEAFPQLAQRFQIQGIPTLVILKNGQEVRRFVGIQAKQFLLQQMQEAGK